MAEPTSRAEPNASVEHAFAVLRLLATADSPIGVADIGRQLGLSLTTTHRVVTTLCEADYVSQQGEGGKYQAGIRVRELLMTLYRRYPIRAAATPAMRELARLTGQAATLTVRFGDRALRIAGVQDHQYVHRPLLIGEMTPLGIGAASRSILAGQDERTVSAQLTALRGILKASEIKALRTELKRAHEVGYVLTDSDGLTVVALPLDNPLGTTIAAISLEGATVQFRPPRPQQLRKLQAVVARLQRDCLEAPETLSGPFDRISEAAMNPTPDG